MLYRPTRSWHTPTNMPGPGKLLELQPVLEQQPVLELQPVLGLAKLPSHRMRCFVLTHLRFQMQMQMHVLQLVLEQVLGLT